MNNAVTNIKYIAAKASTEFDLLKIKYDERGIICNACIPKKCATLKSPYRVLQFTIGRPGPPSAPPTV